MGQTVWHYTKLQSLESMVEHAELWAHRASEMAVDEREISYGLERIRYFALDEFPGYLPSDIRDRLSAALDCTMAARLPETTYVFSATRRPDSARHWSEFGPAEVAVGLDTDPRVLQERDSQWLSPLTGWYPVAYTESSQRDLVQAWVGTLARNMTQANRSPSHWVWGRFRDLSSDQIVGALSPLTHAFKRPTYAEEDEYRYLDVVMPGGAPSERCDRGQVRHFTRIRPSSGRLPITHVRFSSKVEPEPRLLLEQALDVLAHDVGDAGFEA